MRARLQRQQPGVAYDADLEIAPRFVEEPAYEAVGGEVLGARDDNAQGRGFAHDRSRWRASACMPVNAIMCGSPRSGIAAPSSNGTWFGRLSRRARTQSMCRFKKRAGFVEIALQRQRHDHGAARAADTKRQAPRARVAAHFELRANVFEMNGSRFGR